MRIAIEQLTLEELQSFLREQAEDAFPDLKDEQRLAMLSEKWHSYAEFCTCRNEEGCLVGMIAFYANQPEKGVAYIPHVYVSPILRGKGVFKEMFHLVEGYVSKKGFCEIKLEVQNDNIQAINSYKKNGFVQCGEAGNKSMFFEKSITNRGGRILFLDYARSFALFLVVFAHLYSVDSKVKLYIYAFHMPFFFIASGYLHKKDENIVQLIKKLSKRLLVPFCVFLLVGYLYCVVASHSFAIGSALGSIKGVI